MPPRFADHPAHVQTIVRAALAAADPRRCVVERAPPDLRGVRCRLIAAGKASVQMTLASVLDLHADVIEGVVIGPPGTGESIRSHLPKHDHPTLLGLDAQHPLPSLENVRAARLAADLARRSSLDRMPLVVLLSGGASAHFSLPRDDDTVRLSLEGLCDVTRALLHAGATIHELNAVRKHLEQLKGGGLARLAAPAPITALILSDVVGDDLSTIASGPVTPDTTTSADAIRVLEKFAHAADFSPLIAMLRRDTDPAAGAARAAPYDWVRTTIVGSNDLALDAAARAAEQLGFHIASVGRNVQGESSTVGHDFARRALATRNQHNPPAALLRGGETTVHVRGTGVGGRNQELVLAAAIELDSAPDTLVASFGTDGMDGASDAAGAFATNLTRSHARSLSLDAHDHLARNDSHTFFGRVGSLIETGRTGTNVNDVAFALLY